MNRSAIVTLVVVVTLAVGVWVAGPWLWKMLLAMHGRH